MSKMLSPSQKATGVMKTKAKQSKTTSANSPTAEAAQLSMQSNHGLTQPPQIMKSQKIAQQAPSSVQMKSGKVVQAKTSNNSPKVEMESIDLRGS